MNRPIRPISVVTLSLLWPGLVSATTYQVNYEGDDYPEIVGWQRFTTGGGANRTLEDGILRREAMNPSPDGGSDQYLFDREEMLNPDPGELFFAEWRMRLLPGSASSDVVVFIAADGMERVYNSLYSLIGYRSTRDNREILLDTTLFHTYRLESMDMIDYSMFIDGELVWEGFFGVGTSLSSVVVFGDGGVFGASGSEWDYFRFGVLVPAPGAFVLLAAGLFVLLTFRSREMLSSRAARGVERRRSCSSMHSLLLSQFR